MSRAVLVALGTAALISSAAAMSIGASGRGDIDRAAIADSRPAQRERIEQRFRDEREHCATLSGYKREKCIVSAHAKRGRNLLEAAAPYQVTARASP